MSVQVSIGSVSLYEESPAVSLVLGVNLCSFSLSVRKAHLQSG